VSLNTTTDSNGNYSFTVLAGGSYTVTPSLSGYTFSPASAIFDDLIASEIADFGASSSNGGGIGASTSDGFYGLYNPPSVTPSGSGCGDISGVWTETDTNGSSATWNLTQNGSSISGTVITSSGPSCGNVTWQASGSLSGTTFNVTASSPSPTTDQCGIQATGTNQQQITLSRSSCTQGSSKWTSNFGSGTATWNGQVPQSLKVVSARILTDAEMTYAGCGPIDTGLYFQIVYQIFDGPNGTGNPVKIRGLIPQEQLLQQTLKVPSLFLSMGPEDEQPKLGGCYACKRFDTANDN
jgi:hypothetical protein